jgi:hypothetical protein
MTETAAKEAPLCIVCGDLPAEIRSDLGPVCHECKASIVAAENALHEAGIPPQPSPQKPSNPNT